MRVIAGEAGGVPLAAPKGGQTRPTSDKVRGAIFSALGDVGCTGCVLDLFAGSGALGIEALSRGADWCVFVESSAAAVRAIRANLSKTRLADRAEVLQQPVEQFLLRAARAPAQPAFGLVMLDPPYALPGLEALLEQVARSSLVDESTTLLLEHASRRPAPARLNRLAARRTRRHGDSAFTIYTHDRHPGGTAG
jgi:16S rRNA (guanine(966)-N(2))-methyltransferase RsmD